LESGFSKEKKNKDNNTYGKIHASKSKQKINKIRIFEFEFEMKEKKSKIRVVFIKMSKN